MVNLQLITPSLAACFKDVRLRALLDTPTAFGSTHSKEILLSDSDWQSRALQWNSDRSIGYVAIEDRQTCGIAAGFIDSSDAAKAHLISMWVAPSHRQRGIGKILVAAIIDWARSRRARSLCLMVTSNNQSAMAFYQRIGFIRSGRSEPYPNDPALVEYEMTRRLDHGDDPVRQANGETEPPTDLFNS